MTQDPIQAYRQLHIESASKVGLIVLAYNGIITALQRSIRAIESGDIETRVKRSNQALAIIGELKSVLDHKQGGDVARQFQRFYELAEAKILQAGVHNDAVPLQEILTEMLKVRDAWQIVDRGEQGHAAAAPEPAAATPAAPMVAARSYAEPVGGGNRWSA